MEKSSRINTVVKTSIENLSQIIDANTVIGTPIKTEDGDTIIPVSKITFGILSGGGEYGKVNVFKSSEDLPYSAGNGTVVSVKPCGFLVKEDGLGYKILSVEKDGFEKLSEKAIEFISELKDKFNENKN